MAPIMPRVIHFKTRFSSCGLKSHQASHQALHQAAASSRKQPQAAASEQARLAYLAHGSMVINLV
jgi:hypothetical protein